ncbi:MAG: glucose-1-phosphate adenylyltransferase [Candidatus Cloacimonadota bacterium]|nr:MAG: glucose-1-phosphate adenylyltransferase [Candidatus Cloacimonadota bacterium]
MILAGGRGERLYPLTRDRAKPAVPFGGIYRIIDFTLSNCINSGLRKIYLFTQYKSHSLERHIMVGWSNMFVPQTGEFIAALPAQQRITLDWYKGTADAVFQNIYFIQQERPELILILSGDHIYKMDYRKMIRFHIEKNADVTVATVKVPISEVSRYGIIEFDKEKRIVGFEEKPPIEKHTAKKNFAHASMGVYVFNTNVIVKEVIDDAKKETTHDFGRDIIPDIISRKRVFGYVFERDYWRDIGTIDAYWVASMDLVSHTPELNLYDDEWPIFTFRPQLPPAKIILDENSRKGKIVDSIISLGCTISGGDVKESVLSYNVHIHSDAQVEESILMSNVRVARGCRIRKAIIDKGVLLEEGTTIGYDKKNDKKKYFVSEKGILVIPKTREGGKKYA